MTNFSKYSLTSLISIILVVFAVTTPAAAQRFLNEANDGVACWSNTAKDGSGTSYQTLVDTDGHLQVDVLSGGGAGSQFDDGDAIDTDSQGSLIIGTTDVSGTARAVITDNDGHLQVDVLSGGGSGTEYSEDAATPATISGTATLIERDNALSTVTPAEGDWIGLRGSAEGALWTQDFNSDAILADTNTLAGAVSGSEMQVDIVSSAAIAVTDNASSLTVDGTLTCNAGTNLNTSALALDTSVDGLEALITTIDSDTSSMVTNVATISANTGTIDTSLNVIDAGYASEGAALGSGVLLQGDDGTNRKNVNVDATTGDVQVDVTNTVSVDDASGSLTVDGTVTANLSATDNAVLDSIDTDLTTIIGDVDGVEGLLTTIDADTGGILADTAAIQTAVETLDNAISGSEMQVDLVGSVPAGTNLMGDVNIQSSSTSGDGASIYFDSDCDNTAQSVKAGSGNLKGWYISNANAAVACVQIYNVASGSVTVGTTSAAMSLCIPPDDSAANVLSEPGLGFGTQISVACTTTATGSTDPTTGLVVNLFYE